MIASLLARLTAWWRDVTDYKPSFCDRCGYVIPTGTSERCDMPGCSTRLHEHCQAFHGNCGACHRKALAAQARARAQSERWAG